MGGTYFWAAYRDSIANTRAIGAVMGEKTLGRPVVGEAGRSDRWVTSRYS